MVTDRQFAFDVSAVEKQLNKILEMELATVVYYTHYSFMITGHSRIPIQSWFKEQAAESLLHAQQVGDMINHLGTKPSLGIAPLPKTSHTKVDAILDEAIDREAAGLALYHELLEMTKDKSVVLEEFATRLIAAESLHVSEMRLMLS